MAFMAMKTHRESREKSFLRSKEEETAKQDKIVPDHEVNPVWRPEPGTYSDLHANVTIRRGNFGRGIWSNVDIQQGSKILTTKPRIFALSNAHLSSYCSSCCASNNIKRCTRCRVVWYCSPDCQTTDWSTHKLECQSIQNWLASAPNSTPPGEAVRCLGRLLWTRKREGPGSIWWKEFMTLESHRENLPASVFELHTHLAHSLVRYLGVASPSELSIYGLTSARSLVDITSRFTANTFTLTSPSLTPIGVVVSPVTAMINHSCVPNAVVVFPRSSHFSKDEPHLEVVALSNITANEEVLTSYIDTSLPRRDRQRVVKETYNFDCTCPLCLLPLDTLDPREAIWCPRSCGTLCPLPHDTAGAFCNKCRTTFEVSEDNRDKIRLGQDALSKATSLQFDDPGYALTLTTRMISLLTPIIPLSSHPLFALTRLRQSLLISSFVTDVTLTDEAVRTAARSVNGLITLYPEGHPVRGVGIAELGKLLSMDETVSSQPNTMDNVFPPTGAARLTLAHETILKSLKEVRIGFGGEGGEVWREMADIARNVEKELTVWGQGLRHAANRHIDTG